MSPSPGRVATRPSSRIASRGRALAATAVAATTVWSLTAHAQQRGPAQAQAATQAAGQADAQLEGDLEVMYEEGRTGPRLHHYVKVGNERYELLFSSLPGDHQTGTRV